MRSDLESSSVFLSAVSAVILFGYPGDPDRKVPEQAEPETPARKPTTAEAAAEDFIAPGAITQRAIAAYVQAALAAYPVRADWRLNSTRRRTLFQALEQQIEKNRAPVQKAESRHEPGRP